MVGEVVADVEALDVAVLGELVEEVLVEVFKVLLDVGRVEIGVGLSLGGEHVRPLVHIREAQRGADRRLRVQPRAPVPVPARPDLEVERAVHPVLLRTKYRRQVLRHFFAFSTSLIKNEQINSQLSSRVFYVSVVGVYLVKYFFNYSKNNKLPASAGLPERLRGQT